MPIEDDQRAALNIKVSLSTNLILVAMAFVGAEGAIAVFVLDKRANLFWFYAIALLAFIVLALSVRCGGVGITQAYRDGFNGNWRLEDEGQFNHQAVFCVLGAFLVVISSLLGTRRVDAQPIDLHIADSEEIKQLHTKVDKLEATEGLMSIRLDRLDKGAASSSPASQRRRPASQR